MAGRQRLSALSLPLAKLRGGDNPAPRSEPFRGQTSERLPDTVGNLFYVCCNDLADISLVETLQRIFSPMEQFLAEQLRLAEGEIRRQIDSLTSYLPSIVKERLAICCCES